MANVTIRWNGRGAAAAIRKGATQGVNMAAEHLAALSTPLVPYLDGDLLESQDVHQATEDSVEDGAQVQYDTPYAAYQHEGVMPDGSHVITNHSHGRNPAAQTHFLSQPLAENTKVLQAIIAQQVKAALG
jgi:hypothetical protein